jgi:uncharacterized protein YcbX
MTDGLVQEIWRYPVKSMRGESLGTSRLAAGGLLGDRGWATRDEVRGGIRGAKKIAELMRCQAHYRDEPTDETPVPHAIVTLPDGSIVATDAADVDARVSAGVAHPVTLWPLQPAHDRAHYLRGAPDLDDREQEFRAVMGREPDEPLPDLSKLPAEVLGILAEFESPPGTYFDLFPLLVMTRQALAHLQSLVADSAVDVRRFRPNLVLDVPGDDPIPELGWAGRTLRVGTAAIDVVGGCPRCVMTTRAVDELPVDRAILRTIVRELGQDLGVYATVRTPGTLSVGDPVTIDP